MNDVLILINQFLIIIIRGNDQLYQQDQNHEIQIKMCFTGSSTEIHQDRITIEDYGLDKRN